MCPQGDCRNKQPTGNLPTPQSECWKSRLLSTVAHTGTRNVHWHLEKHPLVWMEEVIDPELYFNWTQWQHRSLTQYSVMVYCNLEMKKNTTPQHFGGTEFRYQVIILIEENQGMSGTFPPAIDKVGFLHCRVKDMGCRCGMSPPASTEGLRAAGAPSIQEGFGRQRLVSCIYLCSKGRCGTEKAACSSTCHLPMSWRNKKIHLFCSSANSEVVWNFLLFKVWF